MASFFSVHLALILVTSIPSSSLLSLASSQPNNTEVPTLLSSPSPLPDLPLSSLQDQLQLPPDIAPLLPSHGDVFLPTPTGSHIPTIPSSPSPPNPDGSVASGPLSAFSPSGLLQASSSAPSSSVSKPEMAVFAGLAAYWSMQYRRV